MLKGAALFAVWTEQPHRATKDIDLLGHGDNSIPQMEQVFRQICATEVEDDGLAFLAGTVRGQLISAEDEYKGLRLTLTAILSGARPLLFARPGRRAARGKARGRPSLANEPDTTSWYRKKLQEIAYRLIGRLAPIVGLVSPGGRRSRLAGGVATDLEGRHVCPRRPCSQPCAVG